MGLKWYKNSVNVPCEKNKKLGFGFTLVDNVEGRVLNLKNSKWVLQECLEYDAAKDYFNELVQDEVNKRVKNIEEDKVWRCRSFYINREIAPFICNLLDASDHVRSWKIVKDSEFKDDGLVLIDYESDRQMLIQTKSGIKFDESIIG